MSETVGLAEESVHEEALDRVKPWTVKGIAPEERNAAIAAADRADMTIGEWLTRAIRTQVQADQPSGAVRAFLVAKSGRDRRHPAEAA